MAKKSTSKQKKANTRVDFTPMVALLVIQVLYQVLVNVLHILF